MKTIMAIISFIVQIWNKLHPKKSLEQNLAEEKIKQIKKEDEKYEKLISIALKEIEDIDDEIKKCKDEIKKAVANKHTDKLNFWNSKLSDNRWKRTFRTSKFGEDVLCRYGYTGPDEG